MRTAQKLQQNNLLNGLSSMTRRELAQGLGLSLQTIYKLIKRGMPSDSVAAAAEWRRQNLDITQTKSWRIDGNTGLTQGSKPFNSLTQEALLNKTLEYAITHALTHTVPELWFDEVGILGLVMRDCGVSITAEQVHQVQQCLLLAYMGVVSEYVNDEELNFTVGDILKSVPGDDVYSQVVEHLKRMLETG